MVYGIGQRMAPNIQTWRQHGYTIHVMTGVAWGSIRIISTVNLTSNTCGIRPKQRPMAS